MEHEFKHNNNYNNHNNDKLRMNSTDNTEKKQESRKKSSNTINAKIDNNMFQHNSLIPQSNVKTKDYKLKHSYNTNSCDQQKYASQLISPSYDQSNNTSKVLFDKTSYNQSKSSNSLNKISKQERLKRICSMALNLQSQLKSTRPKLFQSPPENYSNNVTHNSSHSKYLTNRLTKIDINTNEYLKNKIKDNLQDDLRLRRSKDKNENGFLKENSDDLINKNSLALTRHVDLEQTIFDDEDELEKSFRQLLPSESHLKITKKENDRLNSTIIDQCGYNNYSKLDFQHYIDKLKKTAENSRLSFEDNSFKKFTDEIVKRYMQEEEMRSQHQAHLLQLRQRALIEKTNAELSWLKQMKNRLQIRGEDEKMPAILKKHNGIMKKLKEEQDNIKQIKELQKKSSENRLKLLSQHQKVLRWCQNKLEQHTLNINNLSEDKLDISTTFSNILLDSFNNDVSIDDSNFLEPKLIKVKQRLNYEKYFTLREKKLRSQQKYPENLLTKSEYNIGSGKKNNKEICNFQNDFNVSLKNSLSSDEIKGKEQDFNEIAEISFNKNFQKSYHSSISFSDLHKNRITGDKIEFWEADSNDLECLNNTKHSVYDENPVANTDKEYRRILNEHDMKSLIKINFLKNITSLEDTTFSIEKLNRFCEISVNEYFWPLQDKIFVDENCNNFGEFHLSQSFDEMLFDLIGEIVLDLCGSNKRYRKTFLRDVYKMPLKKDEMKDAIILKLNQIFKWLFLEENAFMDNFVKNCVNTRSKWYSYKKLDHIDKLLNTEIHQEEVDWCIYEKEEYETKLMVSDGILDLLIDDALRMLKNLTL